MRTSARTDLRPVEKYPAGDDFHDVLKRLRAELSSVFDEGRSGTTDARRRGRGDVELHHSELAAAVHRIFLGSRGTPIRSVLFCTVPGDSVCDVAWQAAELLAAQSGRRIAFVDDAADSVVPTPGGGNELITRIGRSDLDAAGAHLISLTCVPPSLSSSLTPPHVGRKTSCRSHVESMP